MLARGVAEVDAPADPPLALRSPDAALSFDVPAFDGDGDLTLLVHPSPRFGDGKHANRPWLQELPDPVSKITWHSWVELNPETARSMGLGDGDVVRVRSPHGEVEVPVWVYPGIREDVVALAMGGGHENFGRYADGKGVNPMGLLPAEAEQPSGSLVQLATTVTLEPTGERRRLATVAGSDDQDERAIAPAVALDELESGGAAVAAGAAAHGQEAEPEEAGEHAEEGHETSGQETGGHGGGPRQELQGVGGFVPVPTEGRSQDFPLPGSDKDLYSDPEHTPRWGMAIDLDKCTGCSACVTACQAENNVPWVGEEQVLMGRDMNWIRIERYFEDVDATEAGTVDVRHLPMLCQHCNNAPCEPVCPVFAAYHTPDGLNAQVYNRCVGTRYCANNCPYKVRVFNWYTYTDVPEPLNWQYNPDVTVRDNGVMEK
jgi:molybdopterin-containing oxidoreductase family iron-sulfur binding subunit